MLLLPPPPLVVVVMAMTRYAYYLPTYLALPIALSPLFLRHRSVNPFSDSFGAEAQRANSCVHFRLFADVAADSCPGTHTRGQWS